MAKIPTIPEALNILFAADWLRHEARVTGTMKRYLKVDIVIFFWALILAPMVGQCGSLSSMRQLFEAMASCCIASSAYQKRFSKAFTALLRSCALRAISQTSERLFSPALFGYFQEVLAIDSTLVKLADALQALFPGPRTNSAPAVAKVNAVYSVLSGSVRSLSIHQGKTAEVKALSLKRDLRGTLLLFDLGYFKFAVFGQIVAKGGAFVSRMKQNANPTIVADRYHGPGRKRPLVGLPLWDAIAGLGREELDVDVEISYREARRPTKANPRKTATKTITLRVVGVRHPESGDFHVYLTNITPEQMTPEQVRVAYTARWVVELAFDQLKNSCGMKAFPSARREVVEALIYAAFIRLAVCRVAMSTLRSRILAGAKAQSNPALGPALTKALDERTRPKQFLLAWDRLAVLLLPDVLRAAGIRWESNVLEFILAKAMVDPMHHRDTLSSRLAGA